MSIVRTILLGILLCLSSAIVFSESESVDGSGASFKCIRQVFDQLVSLKTPENVFSDLDDNSLKTDNLGFSYIEYSRDLSDAHRFYFLIRAIPEKADDSHSRMEGYREFTDPFLGVKFIVYVNDIPALGTVNPYEMMQKAADSFYPESSHNKSLVLSLVSIKPNYTIGEKIELDLVLRNVGLAGLRLRKLDDSSVRCYFNRRLGEERVAGPTGMVTLKPGEELRKKIRLPAENKGTLKVYCTYLPKLRGGQPNASTIINID